MTRMSTQWQRHMDSLKRPAAPTLPPRTTQPTGWGREADKVAAAEAFAARYHAANLATPLSQPLSFR